MSEITLLVPCYNAARYLPRLIASVEAQTRPFTTIICYDDGSSDETVAVAKSLGLTIITGQGNHGPAYARNRLLEAARTTWIHFHDADDLLAPRFVERMSEALASEPDVVVCHMDWLTESTRAVEVRWRYDGDALACDALAATISNPIGVIACVYRREALVGIKGFNEGFRTWEDADLHVRLAANGARFAVVPEVLSIGLRHGGGASADEAAILGDRIRLLETYAAEFPSRPAVIAEAEKVAVWLVENRRPGADRLLMLCRQAGRPVPTTRNPAWKAMRALLPASTVIRLRFFFRRILN